jgi:hypothetical protein
MRERVVIMDNKTYNNMMDTDDDDEIIRMLFVRALVHACRREYKEA